MVFNAYSSLMKNLADISNSYDGSLPDSNIFMDCVFGEVVDYLEPVIPRDFDKGNIWDHVSARSDDSQVGVN